MVNKKIIILKTIIISIIFQSYAANISFAWDEASTKKILKHAESYISEIDNDFGIKEFIPHDYYAEAVITIRNARSEVKKEEYNIAYFNASIAIVKLKTAYIYAKAKKLNQEKILLESNYYKNLNRTLQETPKEVIKNYIDVIDANLLKKDNIFRIELLDKNLFSKSRLRLSNRGIKSIDKIIKVMMIHQNSKIKIIGHTSFHDHKKFSKLKSKAIKKYITNDNIDSTRIECIGAGNKIVMNTAIGFRRIDRIEIIVTGID